MEEILEILTKDARTSPAEIAKMVGKSESTVKTAIKKLEKNGTIVSYKTVIDTTKVKDAKNKVRAIIEVSVSPQKNVGFDNIAERIYSFPEVTSCYLLSGAYDLLVIVEGENLQTVSNFVAAKLSSMEAVRSTTTHFLLKKYKEDGHIMEKKGKVKRLNISY